MRSFYRKSIFIFMVFLLIWRFFQARMPDSPDWIHFYRDMNLKVRVSGQICDEPDIRRNVIKIIFCVQEIEYLDVKRNVNGRILANLARYPEWEYGDSLILFGFVRPPPGTDEFSYKNYLKRYGIYAVMDWPDVNFVEAGSNFSLYKWLFRLKRIFENHLSEILTEPAYSLASGLLLGARKGMPEDLIESFQNTGIIHIVAISGYNISLIIVFANSIFGFLSRRFRVAAVVLMVFSFTILVGASASVVRAAVMGSIGLLALAFGRNTEVLILIIAAALIMALWNPYILIYDAGFQLSFAATIGIVYISPFFMKWFAKIPDFLALRKSLALTLSAQIASLPIVLLHFKRFSLIAPLANVAIIPFVPLAMLFSFIALVLSFFSKILAMIFGAAAWFFLMMIIWLARVFG